MIPIIYDKSESSFTSNGLGRLSDAISCEVNEKRNGTYELKLVYPTNGAHFSDLVDGNYIGAVHDEEGDIQPFRIYKISEDIDGRVIVNASHISYELNSIVVKPFTAGTCSETINKLNTQASYVGGSCPFTFWSDKNVTATLDQDVPRDVRSLLGGASGSFLDVFGTGEYEFDKYEVKFYQHRGTDTDVQIRYGVNLTDYNHTADSSGTYNAIVPFWGDNETGDVVTLPEWYLTPTGQTATSLRFYALDLSNDFEEKPTQVQLRTLAQQRLDNSEAWKPEENWKVSFVQLWQTPEYEEVAALQRLKLCDTCLVIYGGQTIREKVVDVTWDVLRERYSSMELGEPKTSFASMIIKEATKEVAKQVITKSYLEEAIDHATDLITGGLGGYLIINTDANGKPYELLIMDTDSTATAVNVWRFNSGGLGHSHNGYAGPYSDVALTMDGKINAAMITTGILTANVIRAGIISDTQNKNSWNLDTGQFITTLGQIGGWTISDNGISKEITVDGTTYRVRVKPPTSYSDSFIVAQILDNGYWYNVASLSMQYGLSISDPYTHRLLTMISRDGVVEYQGTEPNHARTWLSTNALYFYNDNGDLAYGLTPYSMSLIYNGNNDDRYEFDINGLRMYYGGNITVNLTRWGSFLLYNTNGDSLFWISAGDSVSGPAAVFKIPLQTYNGAAIGELTNPFGIASVQGIELVNTTGYIDFHYNSETSADYTSRIIETARGVLSINGQVIGTSDRRLKDNIEDVSEKQLSLLGKLKPRTYNYNKSEFVSAGLVAQEVLEAEEELGITDSLLVRGTGEEIPDPKHKGDTMTDYYGVDYNGLTSLLLARVQKLTKQVETLSAKVVELEGRK